MPLANTNYKPSKEEISMLEPLKPKGDWQISDKDKKTLADVLKRYSDMRGARSRIDVDWQIWQTLIEAKYYPYADGRTRVKVPIFRSLQELFVAEATARRIDKQIEPVGMSDIDKAEVMKEVWDYEWNKNRRDEAMTDAEYQCSAYGTCCYFTGFSQTERVINDPSV